MLGWVKGNEATDPEVINELARLSSENRDLRAMLAARQESFGGLEFDNLVKLLCQDKPDVVGEMDPDESTFKSFAIKVGLKEPHATIASASHVFKHSGYIFDICMDFLAHEQIYVRAYGDLEPPSANPVYYLMSRLASFGLVTNKIEQLASGQFHCFSISDIGRRFRHRLLLLGDRDIRDRLLWNTSKES